MTTLRRHSPLFWSFVRRELGSRFAGSFLGVGWILAGPLLLLGIYALVFGRVFQMRGAELNTDSYLMFVAVALWPWLMFADGVTRGMAAIQANAALLKKVAFPHILLVLAAVTAAFIQHLAAYAMVLLLLSISVGGLQLAGLVPAAFLILILFLFTVGVAALLAALQTLLRDIEHGVLPALMLLHYLTPVLYPLSLFPVEYRHWFNWNPLAVIIGQIRESLLVGPTFSIASVAVALAAVFMLACGWSVFKRLSPYFEDFV